MPWGREKGTIRAMEQCRVVAPRRRAALIKRLAACAVMTVMMLTGNMHAMAQSQGRPGPCLILAYGDSLTAGYGLLPSEAFPSVLEKRLKDMGLDVTVVNAGVSGETSAGGLARLEWTLSGLERMPEVAILELGANDGLQGLDPADMEENLAGIIERFQSEGITVLLAGMYVMANMGESYSQAYNAVFPDLAGQYGTVFTPFFLEGVAGAPELNQMDGIHPNAVGVELIVDNVLPQVLQAMEQAGCSAQ